MSFGRRYLNPLRTVELLDSDDQIVDSCAVRTVFPFPSVADAINLLVYSYRAGSCDAGLEDLISMTERRWAEEEIPLCFSSHCPSTFQPQILHRL